MQRLLYIAIAVCCALVIAASVFGAFITNSEKTTEFFAAFAAAIVAAVAVIVNSYYSAHLDRQAKSQARSAEQSADALYIWANLMRIHGHVAGISGLMRGVTFKVQADGIERPEDLSNTTAARFRQAVAQYQFDFDKLFKLASGLPAHLAGPVTSVLALADTQITVLAKFGLIDDSFEVSRKNITGTLQSGDQLETGLNAVKKIIETELKRTGHLK